MEINEALKLLNSKFVYKKDRHKYFDEWTILHGDGKWEGDCEDYSLTLMWLLSDRNIFKFFWNITMFRFMMWFVAAPSGEGHYIVKIGELFYDNIQRKGRTREELIRQGYKFRFPMLFPMVYVKLMFSYTIGKII
jgi:predicted transglutaminase-like cysteine proteinase